MKIYVFEKENKPDYVEAIEVQGPLILSDTNVLDHHASTKKFVDDHFSTGLDASDLKGELNVSALRAFGGDVQNNEGSNTFRLKDVNAEVTTRTRTVVNAKGQVIGGGTLEASDIPNVPWSKVINKPTTLDGFGITDAVKLSGGTLDKEFKYTGSTAGDLNPITKAILDSKVNELENMELSPIGSELISTNPVTPEGYLRANGGVLGKTDYPELYGVIGDKFSIPTLGNSGQPWRNQYEFNNSQGNGEVESVFSNLNIICYARKGNDIIILSNLKNENNNYRIFSMSMVSGNEGKVTEIGEVPSNLLISASSGSHRMLIKGNYTYVIAYGNSYSNNSLVINHTNGYVAANWINTPINMYRQGGTSYTFSGPNRLYYLNGRDICLVEFTASGEITSAGIRRTGSGYTDTINYKASIYLAGSYLYLFVNSPTEKNEFRWNIGSGGTLSNRYISSDYYVSRDDGASNEPLGPYGGVLFTIGGKITNGSSYRNKTTNGTYYIDSFVVSGNLRIPFDRSLELISSPNAIFPNYAGLGFTLCHWTGTTAVGNNSTYKSKYNLNTLTHSYFFVTKNKLHALYVSNRHSPSTNDRYDKLVTWNIDQNGEVDWEISTTKNILIPYNSYVFIIQSKLYCISRGKAYICDIDNEGNIDNLPTTPQEQPLDLEANGAIVVVKNRLYKVNLNKIYYAIINQDGTLGSWIHYSDSNFLPNTPVGNRLYSTDFSQYVEVYQDGTISDRITSEFPNIGFNTIGTVITKDYIYSFNNSGNIGIYRTKINADFSFGVSERIFPTNNLNPGDTINPFVTSNNIYMFLNNNLVKIPLTIPAGLEGGKNDYSPIYNGNINGETPTTFGLPRVKDLKPNTYAYIKAE